MGRRNSKILDIPVDDEEQEDVEEGQEAEAPEQEDT